jgi:hypothetical protein
MPASDVSIANSALAKLGGDRIISLDDDTREARLLKEQFEKVRDDLLRSHPWNFAIERASLAALVSAPAFGFNKQYQVPSDCLRVLEIDAEDVEWQKEGNVIVTDSDSLSIKYIKKVTNAGLFDTCFCEVFATKLAADVCFAITQNATLKKTLFDEYMQKLREARSYDGQEGGTRQVYARTWLNARV